jgi:hypothetical protein
VVVDGDREAFLGNVEGEVLAHGGEAREADAGRGEARPVPEIPSTGEGRDRARRG